MQRVYESGLALPSCDMGFITIRILMTLTIPGALLKEGLIFGRCVTV